MAKYQIFETEIFLDDPESLGAHDQSFIKNKLSTYVYPQLRIEPHFGPQIRKLKSWKPETWRYRIGPWRCFYEISEKDKLVLMTTLDRRTDQTYA